MPATTYSSKPPSKPGPARAACRRLWQRLARAASALELRLNGRSYRA